MFERPTKPSESFERLIDEGMSADDAFIAMTAVIAGWRISPLSLEHMADLQDLVLAYAKKTDKLYLLTKSIEGKAIN